MSYTSIENVSESENSLVPPRSQSHFQTHHAKWKNYPRFVQKTNRKKHVPLLDSCHPPACQTNIPLGLAMRITRICSLPKSREIRFNELKELLLSRGCKINLIDTAKSRARAVYRNKALQCVVQSPDSQRPVFVVSYVSLYI